MLLVVPLLALLGLAVLAIAVAVVLLLVFVVGIGLYMVLFLPVGVAANVTGATDVDAWGTVEWLLAGGWLLGALGASTWFGLRRLHGWVGSLVEEARSVTDTTETLFPGTPTTPTTDGRVVATTTALAQQVGLPAPDVVVAETDVPEALTVGYRPASTTLVVTEGLLATLDDRELAAVVAHELAHVKNRDAVVMTVVSSVVAAGNRLVAFVWGSGRDHDGLDGFAPFFSLLLFPVVLLARALVAVVARGREQAADRGAVAITGDPAGLASALATLDSSLNDPPSEDFRREAVVALSIVPPPRESIESTLSWDRRRPVLWGLRRPIRRTAIRTVRRVYATHPSTGDRVARLQRLERSAERS